QSHCRPSDGRTCAVGNRAPPAPARTQSPPARRRKRLLARRARAGRCELILRVLERSDLADDFADLKVAAGIEFGMPPLHRLDVFGMCPPGFQRFFGGKAE